MTTFDSVLPDISLIKKQSPSSVATRLSRVRRRTLFTKPQRAGDEEKDKGGKKNKWGALRSAVQEKKLENAKQNQIIRLKKILTTEFAERTEEQLSELHEWILMNSQENARNLFGQAPEYICREICRHMKLRVEKRKLDMANVDPAHDL